MIDAGLETRRPASGAGFADAVTFSFADPAQELFGMARLGIAGDRASALAVLMHRREPVAVLAEGGIEIADGADWSELGVAALRTTVEAPLERWTVAFEGAFDLTFTAASAPGAVTALEGTEGYEQLCTVSGHARTGERTIEVDGVGQRGHGWGAPDWDAIELTRSVSVWLGGDGGVAYASARPTGAAGHADERAGALLVDAGEPVPVFDPRLSTTYDGDGHARRVGFELWVTEDGYPVRAAAEVVCGTSLDLGALSLDVAFLRWHAEGREGVGRYEILRRA